MRASVYFVFLLCKKQCYGSGVKKSRPHRSSAIALYLLGIVVACLCGASASAQGMLRVRLNSDILSTNPGMQRDENTDAVMLHVVEGLVASTEDGGVAPMLARSWKISADGRTYRFFLRSGVTFHNGAPLTTREVAWSLRRYFANGSHWRCKSELGPQGFAKVVSIRPIDRLTLDLVLTRPAPFLLTTLARADCGGTGILHPASQAADGTWRTPIGTGPFRLAEWRRNQFVDLVRFAGYRSLPGPMNGNGGGKRALVDRVRFMVIPDGSSARAALLRGSIDVLDNLAANELAGVSAAKTISVVQTPTMDLYGLLLQTRDPVLSDVRLRRALALSIDVAALTRVATRGTALPNSSPIPRASPYFGLVERKLIARDLRTARALVRESGYRGQPITLITNRRYPQAFDAAIILQAMARDVGIHIEISTLDWATQLARYARGDYQAMIFGYSARLDPALTLDPMIGSKDVDPRRIWERPAAAALLQRAVEESDTQRRQAMFDALDRGFRQDVPGVVLFNTARVTALSDRVTGFKGWPAGLPRLWNVALRGHP